MHLTKIILPVLGIVAAACGQHTSLFNGTDLTGWHPQAECEWSVEDGAIKGFNPQGTWCHLVTDDSSYADYYVTLQYKVVKGNTGLYIRTRNEDGGCCGIEGIQIDIGPSQDGSIMPVVNDEWYWTHLTTKAVDEGIVDYAEWNELAVEVTGLSIKTWVNGVLILDVPEVPELFDDGGIALQLHSGGVGDEILFKDIELYQPTRITGCMDSAYQEYSIEVNDPDSSFCITPVVTSVNGTDLNLTGNKPFLRNEGLYNLLGRQGDADAGRYIILSR